MRYLKIVIQMALFCIVPVVLAQDACQTVVISALDAVDSACNAAARNEICYGNIRLSAVPRENTDQFVFEQSGDIVGVADVESIQLSSMSLTDETWGIALMKLQANLPDTLPGQNVTFLLFGDVSMTDAAAEIVELPVTATSGVNVRLRPTTNASVIQSLYNGQEVTATGRMSDNLWVRVRLDDRTEGWVSAAYLRGDLQSLTAVEPGELTFGHMQAFYFTTGFGDAPCETVSDSGILIQTPQGVGSITLRANNVDIELGSTVYLQAIPDDALYISVIEGHAALTASGVSQFVPAGTVSSVPLDANGIASGTPAYPQPYDFARLQYLPLGSALLEPVSVEPARTEAEIPEAVEELTPFNPADVTVLTSGGWTETHSITQNTCDPATDPVGYTRTVTRTIIFSPDHSSLTFDTVPFSRAGENVYVATNPWGLQAIQTITFTSLTSYTVTWRSTITECTYWYDGTGFYPGG